MSFLASIDEVAEYIGISSNENPSFLRSLISSCSGMVESICCRSFQLKETMEIRTGDGTNKLVLYGFPIVEVKSIVIDDEEQDLTEFDIIKEDGVLIWNEGDFPTTDNSIRVQYIFGYKEIPKEVSLAVKMLVKWFYANTQRRGEEEVVPTELRMELSDMLEPYKNLKVY